MRQNNQPEPPTTTNTAAVIVAAGSSSRMGGVDKIFAPVAGRSVIAHSLVAFEQHPNIGAVVIVFRPDLLNKGAALVSENKVLCHPASVDSIPTSAEKEDHVSMGPIACEKIQTIQKNLEQILAIELLAGCQALDFLRPLRSNDSIEAIHSFVRSQSSFIEKDRSLSHDIMSIGEMISQGVLSDHLAHLDLS